MHNTLVNSTDLRLLLPEGIWLESEYFARANKISDQVTDKAHQWQAHLNALGLLGFEQWIKERLPEQPITRDTNTIETVANLNVGDFKLSVIATENLLDEVVNLPQDAIDQPELAAHFYVVLEVLEEQEQVIIRGFLRYDQLINYRSKVNLQLRDGCYQLPLKEFDTEPNHLLYYSRFLEATAIPLPIVSNKCVEENLLGYLKQNRTVLSHWLEGVFNESWLCFDALISPEANLAFSTRRVMAGTNRGKLIDLGMQLGKQTLALLVNITQDAEDRLGILIQLHPTNGEKYLPPNVKLTLLSKAGKTLQEVLSRSGDNYIQLKPFKGERKKKLVSKLAFWILASEKTLNFEISSCVQINTCKGVTNFSPNYRIYNSTFCSPLPDFPNRENKGLSSLNF